MAIPLGRSWTDPSFVLWQILATTALYFALLGLVAYVVSAAGYLLFSPAPDSHDTTTTLASRLWAHCSHMTIRSLFSHEEWMPLTATRPSSLASSPRPSGEADATMPVASGGGGTASAARREAVTTVGGDVRFLAMHVLTALVAGVAIAHVVHRRKFVADFTCTIYAVYVLAAWVVVGSFPLAVWWWLCTCAGAAVMWGAMSYACRVQEMQDIELAPMVAGAAGGAPRGVEASPTVGAGIMGSVTPVAAAAATTAVTTSYRHARENSQTFSVSIAESKKE